MEEAVGTFSQKDHGEERDLGDGTASDKRVKEECILWMDTEGGCWGMDSDAQSDQCADFGIVAEALWGKCNPTRFELQGANTDTIMENIPEQTGLGQLVALTPIFFLWVTRLLDQEDPADSVFNFIMTLSELSCQQVLEMYPARWYNYVDQSLGFSFLPISSPFAPAPPRAPFIKFLVDPWPHLVHSNHAASVCGPLPTWNDSFSTL